MSTDQRRPTDPDRGFRLEPEFPDENQPMPQGEALIVVDDIENLPLSTEAMVIAGHMGRITGKLEKEMQRLEAAGIAIAQTVSSINPTDQASYANLCERLDDCKKFYEGVEEWADPWRTLFYRPYKAVLEWVTTINMAPITAYVEHRVYDQMFNVCGTLDMLGHFPDGKVDVIVDWKTNDWKQGQLCSKWQLASYGHAFNPKEIYRRIEVVLGPDGNYGPVNSFKVDEYQKDTNEFLALSITAKLRREGGLLP